MDGGTKRARFDPFMLPRLPPSFPIFVFKERKKKKNEEDTLMKANTSPLLFDSADAETHRTIGVGGPSEIWNAR